MTISASDRGRSAYLDSSAIVKLVATEAESDALRAALRPLEVRASSELAIVEVMRRVRRYGASSELTASQTLEGMVLKPVDTDVVRLAASLGPAGLRALDAIHLATALSMDPHPDTFVSYDQRLNAAARAAGLKVVSPA